jgi:hypothetical protein
MTWVRSFAARRGREHWKGTGVQRDRRAVESSVSVAHSTRPGAHASAEEQAVWWTHTADALDLLARHESDPARARDAHADAETARTLARGLGETHVRHLTAAASAAPCTAAEVSTAEAPAAEAPVDEVTQETATGEALSAVEATADVDEMSWP